MKEKIMISYHLGPHCAQELLKTQSQKKEIKMISNSHKKKERITNHSAYRKYKKEKKQMSLPDPHCSIDSRRINKMMKAKKVDVNREI